MVTVETNHLFRNYNIVNIFVRKGEGQVKKL